jgi:hypothetical protein
VKLQFSPFTRIVAASTIACAIGKACPAKDRFESGDVPIVIHNLTSQTDLSLDASQSFDQLEVNADHLSLAQPASFGNSLATKSVDSETCVIQVAQSPILPASYADVRADDVDAGRLQVRYDKGVVISALDPKRTPFELRIRGWTQFRHHAMLQDADTWTDRAGVTRPLRDRNFFDIERARLLFSGYAIDKRLTYLIQLDGDTDGADTVDFFDHWWGWQATERVNLLLGKRKLPGSRQWSLSARHTRFADRPMACDFFRPDRSVGLAAVGKLTDRISYDAMVSNGFRTANLFESQQDNRLALAWSSFIDPFGDFGNLLSDYDCSSEPLMRLGYSWVYSSQGNVTTTFPVDEINSIRLADGTQLTTPSGLIAGQTVSEFDIHLYGIDMAWKYRGWSFNSEVYFRWLDKIQTTTTLANASVYQKGFYVEGGRFLIPRKIDVNARYSQVSDLTASASEYALGGTWFPMKNSLLKLNFDATYLDGSPLQNTASDILVGDNGVLLRSQVQAEF